VAEESTVPAYMALHLALERVRLGSVPPKHFLPHVEPPARLQHVTDGQEQDEEKQGPHVMVIGSLASGKSTLIKTLANWAVKSGRTKLEGPGLLLVNLNPNDVR
jgi:polyribonucleotide 5'-hydroxyl-kinase